MGDQYGQLRAGSRHETFILFEDSSVIISSTAI